MSHYTRAPLGAIAAGVLCAAGAIAILTQDIIVSGGRPTIDHGLQVLIVVLTIAIGHLAAGELRRFGGGEWGRLLTGLPLAAVAALASVWCVYQTAGRTSAHHEAALSAERDKAARLPDAASRLDKNRAMLEQERRLLARECASGKGKRCDGIAASVEVYEDAVRGSEAEVAGLAPKPVGTSAHAFARVVAIMPGVTADETAIAAWLLIVEPLGPSLIFELGAILCFGVRGRRTLRRAAEAPDRPADRPVALLPGASDAHSASAPSACDRTPDVPAEGRGRPERPDDPRKTLLLAAIRADQRAGRSAIQAELALRHGVPRATLSDWLREWEAAGAIRPRRAEGRCKVV